MGRLRKGSEGYLIAVVADAATAEAFLLEDESFVEDVAVVLGGDAELVVAVGSELAAVE